FRRAQEVSSWAPPTGESNPKASNNEPEYEVLIIDMRMVREVGAKHFVAYSDSQLIVKQVEGTYEDKEENMIHYLPQIAKLKTRFESFQLIQILREENVKANYVSKLARALEDCRNRHITVQEISPIIDWRTPMIKWLEEGHLLSNRWEAAGLKFE
ncbi:UNVERIFIED_CONTAM: hypothetical protein Sradi_5423500, partial [Sesamum radiatum]